MTNTKRINLDYIKDTSLLAKRAVSIKKNLRHIKAYDIKSDQAKYGKHTFWYQQGDVKVNFYGKKANEIVRSVC